MPGIGRDLRRYLLNQSGDGYVALSVTEPLDDMSGFLEVETIGQGGYARQFVAYDRGQALPLPGQPVALVNSNAISWTSTAPWTQSLTRPVAWVAMFDVATGGTESTYVGWAPLLPSKLVDRAGITITIPPGALQLTMGLTQY